MDKISKIEKVILEYRRKLIEVAAETYGINIEEMTKIANDISTNAIIEYPYIEDTLDEYERLWKEYKVTGNEIDSK